MSEAWTRAEAPTTMRLGSPVGWLKVGIARNRAIDRLRAHSVRSGHLEAVPARLPLSKHRRGAHGRRRKASPTSSVRWTALPTEQRELIELAYFLGFHTLPELAARASLPLGTVRRPASARGCSRCVANSKARLMGQ